MTTRLRSILFMKIYVSPIQNSAVIWQPQLTKSLETPEPLLLVLSTENSF